MRRLILYVMGCLWVATAAGQLEIESNSRMKFNGNNIICVSQKGNVPPTASYNFSLSPGFMIERTSGNISGGIFISEATAVVLWAGGYGSSVNLVEFCQNTGTTFRRASYINNAGSLLSASDSTLKTHISRLNGVCSRLQGIGAYRYQLKSQQSGAVRDTVGATTAGVSTLGDSVAATATQGTALPQQASAGGTVSDTSSVPYSIGFLAQELEKAFPEAVETRDGVKYVNYMAMVPVLLQAINEQQAVIDQQQKKLQQQEARINALQGEVTAIKKYLKIK